MTIVFILSITIVSRISWCGERPLRKKKPQASLLFHRYYVLQHNKRYVKLNVLIHCQLSKCCATKTCSSPLKYHDLATTKYSLENRCCVFLNLYWSQKAIIRLRLRHAIAPLPIKGPWDVWVTLECQCQWYTEEYVNPYCKICCTQTCCIFLGCATQVYLMSRS